MATHTRAGVSTPDVKQAVNKRVLIPNRRAGNHWHVFTIVHGRALVTQDTVHVVVM